MTPVGETIVQHPGRLAAWAQQLVERAGRIGASPADSSDIALQKRLTVALSLVVVPLVCEPKARSK